ncbi:hypothetical protein M514_28072, partial [Trichuris suis]
MHEMDVKSSVLQRVSRNDVTTAGRPTDRPTDRHLQPADQPTATNRSLPRRTNNTRSLSPTSHRCACTPPHQPPADNSYVILRALLRDTDQRSLRPRLRSTSTCLRPTLLRT